MDREKRKELKKQYENRHPRMGIICWQCGDAIWADMSTDVDADFNSTSFQLKLGSWPNKTLQKAYLDNPGNCLFSVKKELEYEDFSEDHSDDLKILLMDFLNECPDAKPLRVKFNI